MTDLFATILGQAGVTDYKPCYCVGPQDGQPHCPCRMRNEKRVVVSAELDLHTSAPAHIPRARAHLPTSNVLALDLGTHCGWAVAKREGGMDYGTESFHRLTGGAKWAEFRAWLSSAIKRHGVEVLYFEDVKAHGPGQVIAAHVYGGFLAMAQMVCHQHNVRMVGVGVKTVKKDFTGNGNANKEAMVAKAQDLGFRIGSKEHDTADALAILSLAVKQEQ